MSLRPLAAALVAGAILTGCQTEEISVDSAADERGAQLFAERCSGCHTLSAASSQGSKPEGQVSGGERTNGPNFDTRKVAADDVLFAIRNGGFSGAIMPANVVVGDDAEAVADFLEKYSGREQETGDSSNDFGSGAVGN
ncbi:MAG TPA: cytochrome c [Thermoleophilaceae bacterium]|nr:cytochrome c [Thermoleophilaceae bacterium]